MPLRRSPDVRPASGVLVLLLAVLVLAGCADPYATGAPTATPTTPTSDAPARSVPAEPEAIAVVRRFAETSITWTADDLPATKTRLAALATGDLRRQLLRERDQATADLARRPSAQTNTGTVEAIATPPGTPIHVITRETVTLGTDDDGQAGYAVYLATVTRTPAGWRVTSWRAAT